MRDARNLNNTSLSPNTPKAATAGAFNVPRGQWWIVEVQLEMGVNGQANGLLKMWYNGVLTHEYYDIEYEPSLGQTWYWDALHIASTWDSMGGTINELIWMDFDSFYVSGAP
jgi:hypothetical protein